MTDLIRRSDALALAATDGLLDETALKSLPAVKVTLKPATTPELVGFLTDAAEIAMKARAEALKEAADALNERGIREQADFGLDRGTQNFFRARDLVRALIGGAE